MGVSSGKITDKKLGSAKVTVDILPNGRCIPGGSMSPSYITIHDTGNDAPAKNQHNYLKNNNRNGSNAKASWHFSVDDTEIIQAVATNKKAWHAGNATGNGKSIGIEISQRGNGAKQKQAYLNAIELVRVLMKAYNIPISRVVRHKDWTGKDCPYNMNHKKFGYDWNWFKKELSAPSKKEVFDMDKVVLYHGDADVFAAVIVAQKYKCPVMKETDFKVSGLKAKEVVQIGGKSEDVNRFQTFKNAAKLL